MANPIAVWLTGKTCVSCLLLSDNFIIVKYSENKHISFRSFGLSRCSCPYYMPNINSSKNEEK